MTTLDQDHINTVSNEDHSIDILSNKSSSPRLHYANSIGSIDSEADAWTLQSSNCSTTGTDVDSGLGTCAITPDELKSLHIDTDTSITPTETWASETGDLTLNCGTVEPPRRYSHDPPPKSPLYQENELQFYKPKRSSSLKTKRTPPGTPSSNKMVRFADAFGLDLETIRHVFNQESPPKIPASAVWDLHLDSGNDGSDNMYGDSDSPLFLFSPRFAQPGASGTFLHRVRTQGVCLENTLVTGTNLSGTIRVFSHGVKKKVSLRTTFDGWTTTNDVDASYIPNSYDGVMDRFTFHLALPTCIFQDGARMEFAIRYQSLDSGNEYWDNNCGLNYIYECFKQSM